MDVGSRRAIADGKRQKCEERIPICGRGGSDRLDRPDSFDRQDRRDRGRSRVDVDKFWVDVVDKFRVDVGSTGLCDMARRVIVDRGSSVSVTAISG